MKYFEKLTHTGIENPSLELRLLQEAAGDDDALLEQMVERRCAREPLYHIIGKKGFWKDDFCVSKDVLTPRADSETLIELVLDYYNSFSRGSAKHDRGDPEKLKLDCVASLAEAGQQVQTILDLGTGSGCLLLSLLREYPQAKGIGVERSEGALAIAKKNAEMLGLAARCEWHHCDWDALALEVQPDIIICNPPYIPEIDASSLSVEVLQHEPHEALFSGKDGLDDYRNLATKTPRWMHENSVLCLEVGIDQADPVTALFAERFERMECRNDLAGIPRALLLQLR